MKLTSALPGHNREGSQCRLPLTWQASIQEIEIAIWETCRIPIRYGQFETQVDPRSVSGFFARGEGEFSAVRIARRQVRFIEGWLRATLPRLSSERWALIRMDGDMYESTMDALTSLYPNLTVGGYVVVDDYGAIPACRKAVSDYRSQHNIKDDIHTIDWTGVYWRRSKPR